MDGYVSPSFPRTKLYVNPLTPCTEKLLQTINIAQLYGDSKTFVDKPTVRTANETLSDFYSLYNASLPDAITNYSDVTYGALELYVENDFVRRQLSSSTFPSIESLDLVTDWFATPSSFN